MLVVLIKDDFSKDNADILSLRAENILFHPFIKIILIIFSLQILM